MSQQLPTQREIKAAMSELQHDIIVTVCIHRKRPWCTRCHEEALNDLEDWSRGGPMEDEEENPEEEDEEDADEDDEDEDDGDNVALASRLPPRRH